MKIPLKSLGPHGGVHAGWTQAGECTYPMQAGGPDNLGDKDGVGNNDQANEEDRIGDDQVGEDQDG